jgi:hypothetical protein
MSIQEGAETVSAPIITRHHILNELERISRDYEETMVFREFLESGPNSDQLLNWLYEHNVMDEKLRDSVRRKWGPVEGWLGDIHQHGVEKFREAFLWVGRGGPYLSAHLGIGMLPFPSFRIIVHPTPHAVHMLAMCPRLPPSLVQNRAVNDPTFQSYLRGARDSISGLLDLF